MVPAVQITFRNMEPDAKLERAVQAQAAKLERYCDHITSCRVLLEPIGGRYRGNLCHVRIDLGLRKHDLIVEHEPSLYANARDEAREEVTTNQDPGGEHKRRHRAVRDAFAEMRRRLQDCVRERCGSVNTLHIGSQGRGVATPGEEGGPPATDQIEVSKSNRKKRGPASTPARQ
jgi:ribosome-associated translation inhibitor RaiA